MPPAPSVSISGPSSLATGEKGYWRATTPDMEAGYQFTWEYRILFSGCGLDQVASGDTEVPLNAGGVDITTASVSSTSASIAPGPGGPGPMYLPPCNQWNSGSDSGSGPMFAYSANSSLQVELRATATGGGQSRTSPIRSVCIGSCGGGGGALARSNGSDEAGLGDPHRDASGSVLTLPLTPSLQTAWPNPFGPAVNGASRTVVHFTLPEAGQARLSVYDALGTGSSSSF